MKRDTGTTDQMKRHDDGAGVGADLNVPLTSRSTAARRREAAAVRSRLSTPGGRGGSESVAFSHTAYGRGRRGLAVGRLVRLLGEGGRRWQWCKEEEEEEKG